MDFELYWMWQSAGGLKKSYVQPLNVTTVLLLIFDHNCIQVGKCIILYPPNHRTDSNSHLECYPVNYQHI